MYPFIAFPIAITTSNFFVNPSEKTFQSVNPHTRKMNIFLLINQNFNGENILSDPTFLLESDFALTSYHFSVFLQENPH